MIKIVLIGIAAVFLILLLKSARPEFAMVLSLCACVMVLLCCAGILGGLLGQIKELFTMVQLPGDYVALLMKLLGISYLTESGAALCKDAGQTAIAGQIELAGKLVILSISLPVILNVFEELVGMLAAG